MPLESDIGNVQAIDGNNISSDVQVRRPERFGPYMQRGWARELRRAIVTYIHLFVTTSHAR